MYGDVLIHEMGTGEKMEFRRDHRYDPDFAIEGRNIGNDGWPHESAGWHRLVGDWWPWLYASCPEIVDRLRSEVLAEAE